MIFYFFLNPEQIMLYYVLFYLKVKEQYTSFTLQQ